MQQTYGEAMTKVENIALQIIADVAKEQSANMVVAKAALLYMDDAFDVTAEVTRRLDEKLPSMAINLHREAGHRDRAAAAAKGARTARGQGKNRPWPIRASSPSPGPSPWPRSRREPARAIAGAAEAERILHGRSAARRGRARARHLPR